LWLQRDIQLIPRAERKLNKPPCHNWWEEQLGNRSEQTVEEVLYGDKTLGEKIRTIFREQGATITSLLVALSAVIAAIVEAILRTFGGGGAAAAGSTPAPEPGVPAKAKEYAKNALLKLAGWLKVFATKALAALPGIIGAAVSWLLQTAGNAAARFAKNLWALVIAAVLIVLTELRSRKQV
jgi:hypothetical protein